MDAASADSTSALAPDSMKMTTEDGLEQMEMVPDSMDMTTEDGLEQEMDMVPDSMTLDSMKELLPESEMDTVPDSITLDPRASVEAPSPLVLAAEDVVDSLLPADVVALDSQKPDEGITPELLDLPPDSMVGNTQKFMVTLPAWFCT